MRRGHQGRGATVKLGPFMGAVGAGPSGVPGPGRIDRRQDRVLLGILLVLVGAISFPLLNASVKFLTAFYPLLMIICVRYVTHMVFTTIAFAPRHRHRLFLPSRPLLQLVRSLLLLGSTGFFFYALTALPLTTASTIGFTGPLMVTALSMPLLGEKVGIYRWSAVLTGFCGAVIVMQPWSGGPQGDGGATAPLLPALSAFGSAACYAVYQILTRKVAAHDPPETSITFTALVAVVITGLVGIFHVDWIPLVEWWHLAVFAATGFIGGFAHYFVTRAFAYAPAALLSPFDYAQLIGATVLGFFIFGTFPDAYTWIGAAIIVSSGLFIIWREYHLSRTRRQERAALERSASP